MTTYTCLTCDARWERERRRGASLILCPNGHAWAMAREVRPCAFCGEEWLRVPTKGQAPKYCQACVKAGNNALRRVKCWVCGEACIKTAARVSAGRVTCGAACKAAILAGLGTYPSRKDYEAAKRGKLVRFIGECAHCASPFTRRVYENASTPRYCDSCRGKSTRSVLRFVAGACEICTSPFVAEDWTGLASTCSPRCARAKARHIRRARRRGLYVEPVSWQMLYAEHGPTCYLCGEDTDREDFSYRIGSDGRAAFVAGPRFPTHDHVVALSNGGEHSKANARLAHLLCNSIKRDRAV